MRFSSTRIFAAPVSALTVAIAFATAAAASEGGGQPSRRESPAGTTGIAATAPRGPLGPPRLFPAIAATHSTAPAAAAATPLDEAIDRCVVTDMAVTNTPGAQVAVLIDGQLAYERGYGYRHRELGGEVNPDTRFRIGSLTKQFTAAGVLQQVQAGALDLDVSATTLIPELHLRGLWPAEWITPRHLLAHTSGFPDNWDELDGSREDDALAAWAGRQGSVTLHAPPGSFWNYSNPGYMLAGLVLERATGVPFRTYLETEVFARAGLTATTFSPAAVMATHNFAYGHIPAGVGQRETIVTPASYDNAAAAPAGYAFSTAGDLARWASLLMDGGGSVLSPASAEALQGRQVYMDYIPDLYYGYGVMRQDYKGVDIVWHDGSIPGWGSVLLWAPERRFAVALLANTSEPLYAATYCIADAVLQLPRNNPPDYTTDPATWRRYAGTYAVTDAFGNQFEAKVSLTGATLSITFPDMVAPGVPYTSGLVQAYLDTFLFDSDGGGTPDTEVTFVRSSPVTAPTRWLRNRFAVGERVNLPRPTLP